MPSIKIDTQDSLRQQSLSDEQGNRHLSVKGGNMQKEGVSVQIEVAETEPVKQAAKVGMFSSAMMLFSGAIGTGIFGLPLVLVENGLVIGCLMMAIGGVFSGIGQYYLIKMVRVANERKAKEDKPLVTTFSDLLQYAVALTWPNKPSSWVNTFMNVIIVIYIWGGCIVTMTKFLCSFLDPALASAPSFKDYIINTDPAGVEDPNFRFLGIFALFVIWLPLCLPTDFSILRYISYYPLIVCSGALIFAIVMFCIEKTEVTNPVNIPDTTVLEVKFGERDYFLFRYDSDNLKVSTPLWSWFRKDVGAVFALFLTAGRFIFAYMCHTNVVGIATSMEDPSNGGAMKSVSIAVVLAAFFYLVLSVFNYITYGERLASVYVTSYPSTIPSQILRWFLAVMMIFGIPVNFGAMRDSFYALLDDCSGYNAQQERLKAKQIDRANMDENDITVGAPIRLSNQARVEAEVEADNEDAPLLVNRRSSASRSASAASGVVVNNDGPSSSPDNKDEILITPTKERPCWLRIIITGGLLASGLLSAWLIPGVTTVMDYFGSSFAPLIMIGAPAFMMNAILVRPYKGEPKAIIPGDEMDHNKVEELEADAENAVEEYDESKFYEAEGEKSRPSIVGRGKLFYYLLYFYFIFSMVALIMRIVKDVLSAANVNSIITPFARERGNLRLYNDVPGTPFYAKKVIGRTPFEDENIQENSFSSTIDSSKIEEIKFWYENGPKSRSYALPIDDRTAWADYDEKEVTRQYAEFYKAKQKEKTGKEYVGEMLTKEVKWADKWGGYKVDKWNRKMIDELNLKIEVKLKDQEKLERLMGPPKWVEGEL